MEGYTLNRMLREQLQETTSGSFLNDRTSYDYLYCAVQDFTLRTRYATSDQTINIVAGTSDYALNSDYAELALTDPYNRKYIKWTYGGNTDFVFYKDYASGKLEKRYGFIVVASAATANVTGTANATGTSTNGEALLASATSLAAVLPGDFVHNTATSTDGVVIATNTSTSVYTAMFSDGTSGQSWASGNAFVIVRQPQYTLRIYPTPTESATVTVTYIQRQDPVYSLYRRYEIPFAYTLPIVQFAAFLYKFRDREPNYGDSLFKYYDAVCQRLTAGIRTGELEPPAEEKKVMQSIMRKK